MSERIPFNPNHLNPIPSEEDFNRDNEDLIQPKITAGETSDAWRTKDALEDDILNRIDEERNSLNSEVEEPVTPDHEYESAADVSLAADRVHAATPEEIKMEDELDKAEMYEEIFSGAPLKESISGARIPTDKKRRYDLRSLFGLSSKTDTKMARSKEQKNSQKENPKN